MAKLDINVVHRGRAEGSSGTRSSRETLQEHAKVEQSLQRQTALTEKLSKAREAADAREKKARAGLAQLAEREANRIGGIQARAQARAAKEAERNAEREKRSLLSLSQLAEREAGKVGRVQAREKARAARETERQTQREQSAIIRLAQLAEREANRVGAVKARAADRAAAAAERAAERERKAIARVAVEAQRAARARQSASFGRATAAGAGLASGAGIAGAGIGRAAAGFGADATSALSGTLNGSILSGDPFRSAGTLVGGALKAGGRIAGALGQGIAAALPSALSSVGGTIGSLFGGIGGSVGSLIGKLAGGLGAGLAKAIGGALSIAGELGGVLGTAAGEIAGFIGDKLGLALKVAVGGAAVVAFAGISKALTVEQITPAFERLAEASGTTLKEGLEDLRGTTRGLVSDLDLMRGANTAAALGAASSVEQFGELADTARRLGETMGVDTAFALDSMVIGLGRMSPRILDNIGLQIDLERVNGDYAKSLGKTSEELSATEQRQGLFNEIMRQADARLSGLPDSADKASGGFTRFKVTVENTVTTIGKTLLPAFGSLLQAIQPTAVAIGKFFENNRAELAEGMANAVGGLGERLSRLKDIVSGIKLDEVFKVGKLAAESMWIRIKAGAEGVFDYVAIRIKQFALELQALAVDNAILIGALTGGAHGAVAGASFKATVDAGSESGDFAGDLRKEASRVGANADHISFAAQGRDKFRLDEIEREVESIFDTAIRRAKEAAADVGVVERTPVSTALRSPFSAPSSTAPQRTNAPGPGGYARPIIPSQPPPIVPLGSQTGNAPGSGATFASPPSSPITLPTGVLPEVAQFLAEAAAAGAVFATASKDLAEAAKEAATAEAAERALSARRRQLNAAEEHLADLSNRESELASRRKAALDELNRFEKERVELERQRLEEIRASFGALDAENRAKNESRIGEIDSATASRRDQLAGLAGGTEAQGGLPLNVHKAIKKVRRAKEKERFNELRLATQGESSDDLAANGGARLNEVLNAQAAKETGAEGALAAAATDFFARAKEISAARFEAEKAAAEAITSQGEEMLATFEAARAADEALAESVESVADELKQLRKEFESVEKAIKSVK